MNKVFIYPNNNEYINSIKAKKNMSHLQANLSLKTKFHKTRQTHFSKPILNQFICKFNTMENCFSLLCKIYINST